MKKYVLYESKKECSYSFFEEGNQRNMELLEDDAKLIWTVEANSFEIAQMKKHEYLDWEPYKPVIVNERDLIKYVPKDKFDIDNVKLLINLGFPEIKPVLKELFYWIQDLNWPVAQVIAPFLATLGKDIIPEIREVLKSDDGVWKYWVLSEVVSKFENEDIKDLKIDLVKIANNPTLEETTEEVNKLATSILNRQP